ncbi:MAG: dATP/dGTP pyrophosphohydrolase domain-containing protein [Chloroflexota bacterium]
MPQATFDDTDNQKLSLKHLKREIDEVLEDPSDIVEWADCLLLFLESTRRQELSVADVARAAEAKFEINEKRAWGDPDSEGVRSHIITNGAK